MYRYTYICVYALYIYIYIHTCIHTYSNLGQMQSLASPTPGEQLRGIAKGRHYVTVSGRYPRDIIRPRENMVGVNMVLA